jgi:hypothetical protein
MEDRDSDRPTTRRRPSKPPARPFDVPSGQPSRDIGQVSDAQLNAEWTAFHLRKLGQDPTVVNAERATDRGAAQPDEPEGGDEG